MINRHLFGAIVQFLVFCIRKDGRSRVVLAMLGHGLQTSYQIEECLRRGVERACVMRAQPEMGMIK